MTKFNPVWVAAVTAIGLLASVASAQPRDPLDDERLPIYSGGTDIFQYLFHRAGVAPLRAWEPSEVAAKDVIVVILGGDGGSLHVAAEVVRNGGAALIASDSKLDFGPSFRSGRGRGDSTHIRDDSVSATRDNAIFASRPDCPFAVPLDPPKGNAGAEWKLFAGLNRVATNRPSYLFHTTGQGEFRSTLARFPKGSYFSNFGNQPVPEVILNRCPLAVGGSGPHPDSGHRFRFLALSDPSIFFNDMMVPVVGGETDNLKFADRVVSFLAEEGIGRGGTRRRTHCLFIQNGEVMTDFAALEQKLAPQPPPIQLPSLWSLQEKIVDAGNQILDKFQESGGPSSLLMGRNSGQQNRMLRRILRGLLVAASIFAVWFILRRVWGARQPSDIPPAPARGQQPQSDGDRPVPGVFHRRQRELLRRNNLYELIRTALREFFAAVGAPPDTGPMLPKIVIADIVRRPDTLRKAIGELWKIAYGRPIVVTVQKWNLLEPVFDRIQKAHADGKWRFVANAESMAEGRGSEA